MLTREGRVLEEILKTKFNLRSSTEEDDEVKITQRPTKFHTMEVVGSVRCVKKTGYACGWVPLTGKQSTMKDSLVDRITYCL